MLIRRMHDERPVWRLPRVDSDRVRPIRDTSPDERYALPETTDITIEMRSWLYRSVFHPVPAGSVPVDLRRWIVFRPRRCARFIAIQRCVRIPGKAALVMPPDVSEPTLFVSPAFPQSMCGRLVDQLVAERR